LVNNYYSSLIKESLQSFIKEKKNKGDSLSEIIYRDNSDAYTWRNLSDEVEKESRFGKKHIHIIYNYACYRIKIEPFNDIATKPNGKKIDDFPTEKRDLVRLIKDYEKKWALWGEWRNQTKERYAKILQNPNDNKELIKEIFVISINYLYNIIGTKFYPVIHPTNSKGAFSGIQ